MDLEGQSKEKRKKI